MGPLSSLLATSIHQRLRTGALAGLDGEGKEICFEGAKFLDTGHYRLFDVNGFRMKFKLYHSPWGVPEVWWEARRFGRAWGRDPEMFCKNLLNNFWNWWWALIAPYSAPVLHMRKAHDRSRKDKHYLRHLPESSLSTFAVLLVAAHGAVSSRPVGQRPCYATFLASFLTVFFRDRRR